MVYGFSLKKKKKLDFPFLQQTKQQKEARQELLDKL